MGLMQNRMNPSRLLQNYPIDCYLCLFLFSGLALSFSGHGTFVDENLVIQTVESMVVHGDLTVTQMFQALPGPDGKYYSRYGISFPLFLTPFYLIGYGLNGLFPDTYAFYGNPHFFAMLWGNLFITVLTGWLFYRLCRLLGGTVRTSVYLALALIFASSYWPYARTLFRLTTASVVLMGVLYLLLLYLQKKSTSLLIAIALWIAFGLNLREDLVLGFMAIGVFALCRGEGKSRWLAAAALIVGALAGFLIWGWHNWIRFGTIFVENYEDLSFDFPMIVSLPQLLFGLRRGLIVYAPLALILPISLMAAQKKGELAVWMLCAAILAIYLILYSKSSMWHGGQCWGPRHMYFLLPFTLLPGIWWLDDWKNRGKTWFFRMAFFFGLLLNWPGVYAHQGKYQDFFISPSFFSLLVKPVVHPEYITFDELDLWWLRMIKMNPLSLWPIAFAAMMILTLWTLYRLMIAIRSSEKDKSNRTKQDPVRDQI